jgi:hypothetical protein
MFIIVSLYFLYFFVQKISHSYKLLVQNVDKIIPRDMIRNSCQAQKLFTAKQYHTEMYSSLLNEQERGKNNRIFCEKSPACGRWLSEPARLPIWRRVLVGRAPNMVSCIFSAIFRVATAADRYNQGSV